MMGMDGTSIIMNHKSEQPIPTALIFLVPENVAPDSTTLPASIAIF